MHNIKAAATVVTSTTPVPTVVAAAVATSVVVATATPSKQEENKKEQPATGSFSQKCIVLIISLDFTVSLLFYCFIVLYIFRNMYRY